jgi:hypothetical protein
MVRNLIRNQAPGNRLRVRIPCPPLENCVSYIRSKKRLLYSPNRETVQINTVSLNLGHLVIRFPHFQGHRLERHQDGLSIINSR